MTSRLYTRASERGQDAMPRPLATLLLPTPPSLDQKSPESFPFSSRPSLRRDLCVREERCCFGRMIGQPGMVRVWPSRVFMPGKVEARGRRACGIEGKGLGDCGDEVGWAVASPLWRTRGPRGLGWVGGSLTDSRFLRLRPLIPQSLTFLPWILGLGGRENEAGCGRA